MHSTGHWRHTPPFILSSFSFCESPLTSTVTCTSFPASLLGALALPPLSVPPALLTGELGAGCEGALTGEEALAAGGEAAGGGADCSAGTPPMVPAGPATSLVEGCSR